MKFHTTLNAYIESGKIKNYLVEKSEGYIFLSFPDEQLQYVCEYSEDTESYFGGSDEYGRLETCYQTTYSVDFLEAYNFDGDPLYLFDNVEAVDLLTSILNQL